MREELPNHWQCLARIGQLPAHQHHQGKTEEEEDQSGESVLDADHLVVGGENIFSPPPELMMLVFGVVLLWMVMRFERSGTVHFKENLPPQYPDGSTICKARNLENQGSARVSRVGFGISPQPSSLDVDLSMTECLS
jgi:hypothetical protein